MPSNMPQRVATRGPSVPGAAVGVRRKMVSGIVFVATSPGYRYRVPLASDVALGSIHIGERDDYQRYRVG